MSTLPRNVFRQLEKHGLRCIYGYNQSIDGYPEPRTISFQLGDLLYRLGDTSFLSNDHKLQAQQMLEAQPRRAIGVGLNFTRAEAQHDIDGATELLRCVAEINIGLLEIVGDSVK